MALVTAPQELIGLGKAIGVLDADGALNADWFTDPGDHLSRVFVDPVQRDAALDLVEQLLACVDLDVDLPDPGTGRWLRVVDAEASNGADVALYVIVDDSATGRIDVSVAAAASLDLDGADASFTVRIPLASFNIARREANVLDGSVEVGASIELDDGLGTSLVEITGMTLTAVIPTTDLEAASLTVLLRGLRLPGQTVATDITLGDLSETLGPDAIQIGLALLQAQLATLGQPILDFLSVAGLNPSSPSIPPLPLEALLGNGVASLRSWFLDLAGDTASLTDWLTALARLLGFDPPMGSGTPTAPYEVCLEDPGVWKGCLTLAVANDAGTGAAVLTPGAWVEVTADTSDFDAFLRGTVEFCTITLGPVVGVDALPRLDVSAVIAGSPLVDTTVTVDGANLGVSVGAIELGLRLVSGSLAPLVNARDVDITIDASVEHHDLVDLTSAESISDVASGALDLVVDRIVAAFDTPPARALAILAGLVAPSGAPANWPDTVSIGGLFSDPVGTIGCYHAAVLETSAVNPTDPAPWSLIAGQIGVLLEPTGVTVPTVSGDGVETSPWTLTLFDNTLSTDPVRGQVELVAWVVPTDGSELHVALRSRPVVPPIADLEITVDYQAELARIGLPAASQCPAAITIQIMRCHTLSAAMTGVGGSDLEFEIDGLVVGAERVSGAIRWCGGDDIEFAASVIGPRVVIDSVPVTLPDLELGWDVDIPDLDITVLPWEATELLVGSWFGVDVPDGSLALPVLGALAGWVRPSGDVNLRLPHIPDLDLTVPAGVWPRLSLETLLGGDPIGALRVWLGELFSTGGGDLPHLAWPLLAWLGDLLVPGDVGGFSLGDLGSLELDLEGTGTYDDPWVLPVAGCQLEVLVWLDPDGPSLAGVVGLGEALIPPDLVDAADGGQALTAARIGELLEQASTLLPELQNSISGLDLPTSIDALRHALIDGDGLVPATAQAPDGWATAPMEPAAHLFEPSLFDPSAHLTQSPEPEHRRVFVATDLVGLSDWPGQTPQRTLDLTAVGLAPEAVDISALTDAPTADGPWYVVLASRADAAVVQPETDPSGPSLSGFEGLTGRLRRVIEAIAAGVDGPLTVVAHGTAGHAAQQVAAELGPATITSLVTVATPHAAVDFGFLDALGSGEALRMLQRLSEGLTSNTESVPLMAMLSSIVPALDEHRTGPAGAPVLKLFPAEDFAPPDIDPVPAGIETLAVVARTVGTVFDRAFAAWLRQVLADALADLGPAGEITHVGFGLRSCLSVAAAAPGAISVDGRVRLDLARIELQTGEPRPMPRVTATIELRRSHGWLVRGPGITGNVDRPRDPRVRWAEIHLDATLAPVDVSTRIVLHDASVFGVSRPTWVIDEQAIAAAIDLGIDLPDHIVGLVPEARILLGEIFAAAGPLPAFGSTRCFFDLLAAMLLVEIDSARMVTLPPDAIERFLVDPAGEVGARLDAIAPTRGPVLAALRACLGSLVTPEMDGRIVVPLAAGLEVVVEIGINGFGTIPPVPTSLCLAATGFVLGGSVTVDGQLCLVADGRVDGTLELRTAGDVGPAGRIVVTIGVTGHVGAVDTTVDVRFEDAVVAGFDGTIPVFPVPDLDAVVDWFGGFLLTRFLDLTFRAAGRLNADIEGMLALLVDGAGSGEIAYRHMWRLIRQPCAWLLHPDLLGEAGDLPALAPTPLRGVLERVAGLTGVAFTDDTLALPWDLTLSVSDGGGVTRIELEWEPDGHHLDLAAVGALEIRPGCEIRPSFSGVVTVDGLPVAYESATLGWSVDAAGTVSVTLRLTPTGGTPFEVELLPTLRGLEVFVADAGQTAVQLLPIVLDALVDIPGIGVHIGALGDLLGLRPGGRFDPVEVAELANPDAPDIALRLGTASGVNLQLLLDSIGGLFGPFADSFSVDLPGRSVEFTALVDAGISVSISIPVTGTALCVRVTDLEIPSGGRPVLSIDARFCVDATGVDGLAAIVQVIDAEWLAVGAVGLLPHAAVLLGSEARSASTTQDGTIVTDDRVEVGMWIDEPPGQTESRTGLFVRIPTDGGESTVVCRSESGANADRYTDTNDLDGCVGDAVLAWLGPMVMDVALTIEAVVDLLDRPVRGRAIGDAFDDAGLIDKDPVTGVYRTEPGFFDPARIADRLLQLASDLIDDIEIPGVDPFTLSLVTDLTGTCHRYGLRVAVDGEAELLSIDGLRLALVTDTEWMDDDQGIAPGATLWLLDIDGDLANPVAGASFGPGIEIGGVGIRVENPSGDPLVDLLATIGAVTANITYRKSLSECDPSEPFIQVRAQLEDFSLPLGAAAGGNNPVAAKLLSDTNETSGGGDSTALAPMLTPDVVFGFVPPAAPQIRLAQGSFPLWQPIQKSFGPVYVEQLGVSIEGDLDPGATNPAFLIILLDGSISIEGFMVQADDLAVRIPIFDPLDLTAWEISLAGLAIAYSRNGVDIAGGFRWIDDQYAGLVQVQAGQFGITAIGAYGEFPESPKSSETYTSMFIFGVLNAPLGGVPPFFVTGIGAGVGLNRALAIPADVVDVVDFALVEAMSDTGFANDPMSALSRFIGDFPVERGTLWLAAGVKFTSFALVKSVALLTVQIGEHLEIDLLGVSTADLPSSELRLAAVEMALRAHFSTADMVLSVEAQLTDNSWILTENARLTGGFAFVIQFETGQFAFTLGGFHPRFKNEHNFPEPPRLGFEWSVSNALAIKGESYFALTATCVMAGGKLEASYSTKSAWATLTVGADALLSWDPFYYDVAVYVRVSAGINVRVCIIACATIRASFSIGVDVLIQGPKLYGRATLDLDVISVTIEFGNPGAVRPHPEVWQTFLEKYLSEAENEDVMTASLARGLQPADPSTSSTESDPDDGSAARPWKVLPEFTLVTSTRAASNIAEWATRAEMITDIQLDIGPMQLDDVVSRTVLSITGPDGEVSHLLDVTPIRQHVPEAPWTYVAAGSESASARTISVFTGFNVISAPTFLKSTVDDVQIEIDQIDVGEPHPLPFPFEVRQRVDFGVIATHAGQYGASQPVGTKAVLEAATPKLATSVFERRVLAVELTAPPRLAALGERLVAPVTPGAALDPLITGIEPPVTLEPGQPRIEALVRIAPTAARQAAPTTSLPPAIAEAVDQGKVPRVEMPTIVAVEAAIPGRAPARLELVGAGLGRSGATVVARDGGPDTRFTGGGRSVGRGTRLDRATSASLRAHDRKLGEGAPLVAGDVQVWKIPNARYDAGDAGRRGRPRWRVTGNQRVRTVCLSRGGRMLADHSGDIYDIEIPRGTERIVTIGLGRTSADESLPAVGWAGWQDSTTVARIGTTTYLGPECVLRVDTSVPRKRRVRGRTPAGVTSAGAAIGNGHVETTLPSGIRTLALVVEVPGGPSCEASLLDQITLSLDGAEIRSKRPKLIAAGDRMTFVYSIQPTGGPVTVTVASGNGWRVAGVVGSSTTPADSLTQLQSHDLSTLTGSLVGGTAGESRFRFSRPVDDRPGTGPDGRSTEGDDCE
ncbi:MAG: DUF6603 domain-containing protein [Acidimicrobiia bacterium]